jgi:hypothetical protein
VRADIDGERVGECGGVELVGAEQEQGLEAGCPLGEGLDSALGREAEVKRPHPRRSGVEQAEAGAQRSGGGAGGLIGAVGPKRPHADDDRCARLAVERFRHLLRKPAERG